MLTIQDVRKLMPGDWHTVNDGQVYQMDGCGHVIQFYVLRVRTYPGNFAIFYLDGLKIVSKYGIKKEEALSFYKKNWKFSNFK